MMMTIEKNIKRSYQLYRMIPLLVKLGLTLNEATVYDCLLGLGMTTAGEIIKRTHLHRNIVYDNLEKLIEKGLVSFVILKGIKHFESSIPQELNEFVEKQKQEILDREAVLKTVLPLIEAKRKSFSKSAEASIFKGKIGLRNVLEQLTSPKQELIIFATGWGMKATMGSYYQQWHLKLKKNKVRGRAVLGSKMRLKEQFPYKIRYLPQKFVLPSTILLYGDKVITVVWQDEPLAIIIESSKISKSYKAYFEVLWKIAKK